VRTPALEGAPYMTERGPDLTASTAGTHETPAAHAAPGAGTAVGVRPRRPVPSWARPDGPASEEAGTPAVTGTGSLAG
ncbi:hypothetical protein AB0D15_32345, partial [Streptomyces sp. NPDC048551]